MYILNRLAVGNPPLGFRYLVKSSSFFRVVFRVLNRGLRLNLPGRGERRAAERGTGGGARDWSGSEAFLAFKALIRPLRVT